MMTLSTPGLTELLSDWQQGDQTALNKLTPLVYDELRRIAHRYVQRERNGHTLGTTALVNEAYLRLAGQKKIEWQNRAHFFAVTAQVMRHILIDHARRRHYAKHGGNLQRVSLSEAEVMSPERARSCWRWTKRWMNWRSSTCGRAGWWSCVTLAVLAWKRPRRFWRFR